MTARLLVAIGAVLGLVIFAQVPGEDLWAAELTDFGHGPAFAVLTLLLFKMLRARSTRQLPVLAEYAAVVVMALALGAIVELLQGMIGRDESIDDLLRDAQGTLAAVGFLVMLDPKLHGSGAFRPVRLAGLLLGLAGTAMLVWPPIMCGLAHLDRNRSFPTLADFDRPTSLHFVHPLGGATIRWQKLPPAFAGHAGQTHALRVDTTGRSWWGLMLREPLPDWRHYQRLAVTIANPSRQALTLELRVHDREANEDSDAPFTSILEIPPLSWRTDIVPLAGMTSNSEGAGIDLAHVRSLMLARKGADHRATEFYLVRLRLELPASRPSRWQPARLPTPSPGAATPWPSGSRVRSPIHAVSGSGRPGAAKQAPSGM